MRRGSGARLGHEGEQDEQVRDEGGPVEEEEDLEAPGPVCRRDQAADERAEADAEVHHDALSGERGRAALDRRQPGDHRRLRRPEGAVADPRHDRDRKRLPWFVDQCEAGVAGREETERDGERAAASDSVDKRSGDGPGDQADGGVRAEHEPGGAEPDPAHVVEVDEREREHDPVAEGVQQAARLQRVHRPRQLRVEAQEPAAHRETVATWTGSSTPA